MRFKTVLLIIIFSILLSTSFYSRITIGAVSFENNTTTTPSEVTTTTPAPSSELIWNQTGTFVSVPPFQPNTTYSGVIVNAYYVNETHVKLIATSITNDTVSAIFEIYDYYNSTHTKRVTVNNTYGVYTTVFSNVTVFYIEIYKNGFFIGKLGPYYIRYYEPIAPLPSEVSYYAPFLLLAFFISFVGRGYLREVALGFLAFGLLVGLFAAVFGITNPWLPGMSGLAITFSIIMFAILYFEKKE